MIRKNELSFYVRYFCIYGLLGTFTSANDDDEMERKFLEIHESKPEQDIIFKWISYSTISKSHSKIEVTENVRGLVCTTFMEMEFDLLYTIKDEL